MTGGKGVHRLTEESQEIGRKLRWVEGEYRSSGKQREFQGKVAVKFNSAAERAEVTEEC